MSKRIISALVLFLATVAYAGNETVFDADRMSVTTNSDPITLDSATIYDITATVTESQPANDTAISGTAEVQTVTFEATADSDAGDWILFYDASGTSWGYSTNKGGADAEPTDPLWTALDAAYKTHCDISGATTAAQVAAAAELCIDALVGLTDVIVTSDVAGDGTMTFTQVEAGPTTNMNPQNAAGDGNGGLTSAETTPGVAGKVSVSGNTINFGAHGYLTGLKGRLTTTGGLPTGLSTGTDYWLIKVDDDSVKVASSAANALAGTAIDITAIGSGTHTFTVDTDLEADIKLQKNNSPVGATAQWVDISNSTQAVDAAGNFNWTGSAVGFKQIRLVFIGDSSEATVTAYLNWKE